MEFSYYRILEIFKILDFHTIEIWKFHTIEFWNFFKMLDFHTIEIWNFHTIENWSKNQPNTSNLTYFYNINKNTFKHEIFSLNKVFTPQNIYNSYRPLFYNSNFCV